MNVREAIERLEELAVRYGDEEIVCIESHGCCTHGHEVEEIRHGEEDWDDGRIVFKG
jgi:hypothetical protein